MTKINRRKVGEIERKRQRQKKEIKKQTKIRGKRQIERQRLGRKQNRVRVTETGN